MSKKFTAQEIRSAVQKSICEDNIAEMLLQYADELEREKRYEYAIRFDESKNLYARSTDYEYAKRVMDNVCADGLIVCHIVRRSVGEWEEVE